MGCEHHFQMFLSTSTFSEAIFTDILCYIFCYLVKISNISNNITSYEVLYPSDIHHSAFAVVVDLTVSPPVIQPLLVRSSLVYDLLPLYLSLSLLTLGHLFSGLIL